MKLLNERAVKYQCITFHFYSGISKKAVHLHLKHNNQRISSIRVNDQYRIEFTIRQGSLETIVTICNILELSNHYK